MDWVGCYLGDMRHGAPMVLIMMTTIMSNEYYILKMGYSVLFLSVRNSYSDGGLLYIDLPLFEILSISANIFSFSFCELNAD